MNVQEIFAAGHMPDRLHRPFIIAEAGVNHECDLRIAMKMIDAAAEGGAHAIKFQNYRARQLASQHSPAYWNLSCEPTTSQYALFRKYDKFRTEDYEKLHDHARRRGVSFLVTPFDADAVDCMAPLVPAMKIASADITNKPFLQHAAAAGRPVLLSVGASGRCEIERAVRWVREKGAAVILMHCVLNYPTADENAHLGRIAALREVPGISGVGYSDHTLPGGMENLLMATALGAVVLEKHFTWDKNRPGNDHYHAMDVSDLKKFNRLLDSLFGNRRCISPESAIETVRPMIGGERWRTLFGDAALGLLPCEETARRHARRSITAAHPIPEGKRLAPEDLCCKRPAAGIAPYDMEKLLGLRAAADIPEDVQITWEMVVR